MTTNRTLLRIARKFQTPLYVYDHQILKERCKQLQQHFPGFGIFYAVKANGNPALLTHIHKEGIGVEAVTPGEIKLAQSVGVPKDRISFTCSNLTLEELRFAAKNAAHVHLDSLVQLELWGKHKLGKEVSLRINEGIGAGHHAHVMTGGPDSKFGISERDIPKARKIAATYGLRITGLEQHIGSNVLSDNEELYLRAVKKLLDRARTFPEVRHIDFGGGIGIPYTPGSKGMNLKRVGKEVAKLTNAFAKERGGEVTFAIEPGRFLVAESGTLLVSVVDMKSTSTHNFVGVNSGFTHLIRPMMYGSYHPIENLSRTKGTKKTITIAGNICESGDLFATKRNMLTPALGDILAIRNAGAYGMNMVIPRYNLRPLPRELLLMSGKTTDISYSPEPFVR